MFFFSCIVFYACVFGRCQDHYDLLHFLLQLLLGALAAAWSACPCPWPCPPFGNFPYATRNRRFYVFSAHIKNKRAKLWMAHGTGWQSGRQSQLREMAKTKK